MENIKDYPQFKFFADDANELFGKLIEKFNLKDKNVKKSIRPHFYKWHERTLYCTYCLEYDETHGLFQKTITDNEDTWEEEISESVSNLVDVLYNHYHAYEKSIFDWEIMDNRNHYISLKVSVSLSGSPIYL